MTKSVFVLLLTMVFYQAFAGKSMIETQKKNGLSIGLGHVQFKDENIHPKVFRGLNLDLTYSHSVEKINSSEYSFGLNTSFLNTRFESFPSALGILLKGSYKYLFPIAESGKLKYSIGPVADLQYGANLYFNWDESHLYYANYLSGGLSNRLTYKLVNNLLVLNVDIPLFAVICRPMPNRQYKIDDMTFGGVVKNLSSNPQLALPDRNFDVKIGLEYRFNTSKNKTRSLGYHFRYHFMQAIGGEPYQHVCQTLSYQFIF